MPPFLVRILNVAVRAFKVLAPILALSVLLAFVFHFVMMVVVALVGWNTDTLTLTA